MVFNTVCWEGSWNYSLAMQPLTSLYRQVYRLFFDRASPFLLPHTKQQKISVINPYFPKKGSWRHRATPCLSACTRTMLIQIRRGKKGNQCLFAPCKKHGAPAVPRIKASRWNPCFFRYAKVWVLHPKAQDQVLASGYANICKLSGIMRWAYSITER